MSSTVVVDKISNGYIVTVTDNYAQPAVLNYQQGLSYPDNYKHPKVTKTYVASTREDELGAAIAKVFRDQLD